MENRKIILYRSRFQPKIEEPHIEAIEQLIRLLNNENINIGQCLFGFSLVKHDYEDTEITIKQLKQQGFSVTEWTNYLARFSDNINTTSIGQIKTDIAFSNIGLNKRTATFIIPNLIRTAIALYKRDIDDEDKKIRSSLPNIKNSKNDIHWYFPIYDMDDINDMGYLASIYFQNQANNDIDKTTRDIDNKILFSRYNYYKNNKSYYKFRNNYYGRYIATSEEAKKEIEDNSTIFDNSKIPNIDEIPFVYKWTSIYKIATGFKLFFDKIKSNQNISAKLIGTLEDFINSMDGIIDGLKDNKKLYSDDLIDFFYQLNQIKDILEMLEKMNSGISNEYKTDFTGLYKLITEKYQKNCKHHLIKFDCKTCNAVNDCKDFYESHIDEKKRVEQIMKILDKYNR